MLRILGGVHLFLAVVWFALFPLFPPFGLINAWLTIVGVILLRPRRALYRAAIVTVTAGLGLAALVATYGVFAMVMQARSAARGGGLLGGFGELVLGFALVLATLAAADLVYLTRQTKYLVEIGFTPSAAAYALGFVGLTGVGGQIALGHLSDRIGREWVWTLACLGFVLCYALLLAMPAHPTPALLYLMVASQGLLGYGLASVFGAIPAELFQGRHYGTVFGALALASQLGAGAGPWIAGLIHDRTGSYVAAFWLAIGLSLVSVLAMWRAAPGRVRAVAGRIARRGAPA